MTASPAIQFVPQTERAFLASLTPPLADNAPGARGRFSNAGKAALAAAREQGFRFVGDEGHPDTVVKATRAPRTVTTPAATSATATTPEGASVPPAVANNTVTTVSANPSPAAGRASFVAKDVRAWAKQNGHAVGERGRIHPNVIAAFVKAGGKPSGPAARRVTPNVMPRIRPQSTGYSVIDNILIRQEKCSACTQNVSQCPCKTGPRAHKFLETLTGGVVPLVLDHKPVV
jgi:hypothetical protein